MRKRRKRSHLSEKRSIEIMKNFFADVERWGTTTDSGMFSSEGWPNLPLGKINYQFLYPGDHEESIFEAMRVLGGHKLPRKQ